MVFVYCISLLDKTKLSFFYYSIYMLNSIGLWNISSDLGIMDLVSVGTNACAHIYNLTASTQQ